MELRWEESFRVRAYEVGPNRRVNAAVLCNYLQETAGMHANHLHFGMDDLAEKEATWVLSRLTVEIESLPEVHDEVVVRTWPRGTKGIFAMRDFELFDARSNHILRAASGWLVIDPVSKRPRRFTEITKDVPVYSGQTEEPLAINKIPGVPFTSGKDSFPVRISDLDINLHANNVRYIEWIMDDCEEVQTNGWVVQGLEVNFMAECKLGDNLVVASQVEPGEMTFSHSIWRSEDEKEVCRARTKWTTYK